MPVYSNIKPRDPSLEYILPADAAAADPQTSTEEFDFEASLVVFSETKALDLTNKFRKEADAYYVEAKRSTVSSIAQVPYWMYGMLVVLGWNEAMAILFNPLYFTFLLFALAASCVNFRFRFSWSHDSIPLQLSHLPVRFIWATASGDQDCRRRGMFSPCCQHPLDNMYSLDTTPSISSSARTFLRTRFSTTCEGANARRRRPRSSITASLKPRRLFVL